MPAPDPPPRGRLLALEAAGWLVLARLLVARARFSAWGRRLGEMVDEPSRGGGAQAAAHRAAWAVERAAARLPIAFSCLPRAIALHAMLRRRGLNSQIVLAVLAVQRRGSAGDLHAWVESGGEILIGASDLPYHAVARFSGGKRG